MSETPERQTEDDGRGTLFLIGLVAVALSIGYGLGPIWGWLFFGVLCMVWALAAKR